MSDVVEFLRERLDEDEEIARRVVDRWYIDTDGCASRPIEQWADGEDRLPNHHNVWFLVHDPARVLRDVDAKRKIVEAYHEGRENPECLTNPMWHALVYQLKRTCHALASAYSDHPDYLREWGQ